MCGRIVRGHVLLDLSQGAVAGWKDGSAHVDVTLDERRARGERADRRDGHANQYRRSRSGRALTERVVDARLRAR